MAENLKDPPKAWVWSEYRAFLPDSPRISDAAAAVSTLASQAADTAVSAAQAVGRSAAELPPLVPQQSGSGAGMLAGLLILAVIGGVWWMTQTAPPPSAPAGTETSSAPAQSEEKAAEPVTAAPSQATVAAPPAPAPAAPAAKSLAETVAEKVAAAKEKLAGLPSSGALDAAACESALNATVTVEKIQFRSGSAAVQRASGALLDRVAGLLKRCVDAKAEINGYTDNVGAEAANVRLSERRANAVRDYLKSAGVRGDRLTAIGHGPANPVASNDSEEGRAENRRIEFAVK